MKPTQSTKTRNKNELRFILVEGLLKGGFFFTTAYFLLGYLFHYGFSVPDFKSSDFLDLAYKAIINGAVFGLCIGLFRWHQNKKNSK